MTALPADGGGALRLYFGGGCGFADTRAMSGRMWLIAHQCGLASGLTDWQAACLKQQCCR